MRKGRDWACKRGAHPGGGWWWVEGRGVVIASCSSSLGARSRVSSHQLSRASPSSKREGRRAVLETEKEETARDAPLPSCGSSPLSPLSSPHLPLPTPQPARPPPRSFTRGRASSAPGWARGRKRRSRRKRSRARARARETRRGRFPPRARRDARPDDRRRREPLQSKCRHHHHYPGATPPSPPPLWPPPPRPPRTG